ncbi:MAG: hypothetical protein ACK4HV_06665 [Parachlamydiaceae bacterium]
MDYISLLVSLVSGLVGGNIAGALSRDKNFSTLANSIVGAIGGGAGAYILKALGFMGGAAMVGTGAMSPEAMPSAFDIGSLLTNVGGSGLGGLILTFLVNYVKGMADKKA